MTAAVRIKVKCRQIDDADLPAAADCLARGFPHRPRPYWAAALERLRTRPAIDDYPRYGVLLEFDGHVVGVLLQIFFRRREGEHLAVYCNLSSWCTDPAYRGFGMALNSAATKRKEVTYVNVSPAPHTRPSIEAVGFRRYCDGQFICLPWLARSRGDAKVSAFAPDRPETALLSDYERDLLAEHAALGCRSLTVAADDGVHPFVFTKRKVMRRLIPCEQLIYCRDLTEFVDYAGALGRYLLARGAVLCVTDANQKLRGLLGRYLLNNGPKYFKGPTTPRLGDLSFTELTILGP
jgi:hypothetical protein